MTIGIIVQARMSSTRLPGKILKPFYGSKTLLETLLDTLHDIDNIPVIVATSLNPNDDQLYNFLINKGEFVFRGAESDVLDRFIKTADKFNLDGIVRVCSDNPFLSREGIISLIDKAKVSSADYIGYRINNKPSILTHFGFWGEYVRLSALKRVAAITDKDSPAHEHVTYYVYNNLQMFFCEWIDCPDFLQGRKDIRLTIDTIDDFKNAAVVYAKMKEKNGGFSLCDVVEFLDNHRDIKESMIKKIQENQK